MAGQMLHGFVRGRRGRPPVLARRTLGSKDPCRRAWWSFSGYPRAEGPSHVRTHLAARRSVLRHAIVVGLALGGVASVDGSNFAQAQGKLEARYSVTLGGVSFGQ